MAMPQTMPVIKPVIKRIMFVLSQKPKS